MIGSPHHLTLAGSQALAHVLTDLNGTFLSVDDAYCEILGRERVELIGRDAIAFTNPAERPLHAAAIAELRETSQPLTIRKNYLKRDGTLIQVENVASIVADGLGPRRMIATVRRLEPVPSASSAERELTLARIIAQEHISRFNAFGTERFAGLRWTIVVSCFILECQGRRTLMSDICREAEIENSLGFLEILHLVAGGDIEFERPGSCLDDSSARLTHDTFRAISSHFAEIRGIARPSLSRGNQ